MLILLIGLACTACEPINAYFGLANDNWIEEAGEAVLKEEVDISVDFTPLSPEK